jgi:hypothetical protein
MSKPNVDPFEKLLITYQKLAMSLCYPALVGAFSIFVDVFSNRDSSYFATAGERTLYLYLSQNPLGGNGGLSSAITCLVSLALAGLFIMLALWAAKGKWWPILVGSLLYLADAVYLFCLLNSSLYGAMELTAWIIQLLTHLLFLALFVASACIYAKLVRLQRKHPRN